MLRQLMKENLSEAGSSSWQKLRLSLDEVSIWKGLVSMFLQGFLGCLVEDCFIIYFSICLCQDGIGHKDGSITDTHLLFHWN